jgi:hypothetical protein
MKAMNRLWILLVGWMFLASNYVFAQDAAQTSATTSFNNNASWIISLIAGPVCKVVGAFFLFAGIGKLMKQEVMGALMCGVAFMILVLMPQILTLFPQASATATGQ